MIVFWLRFALAQIGQTTKEMEEKVWEASAGGGAVTVKVSGKKEVVEVKLAPPPFVPGHRPPAPLPFCRSLPAPPP